MRRLLWRMNALSYSALRPRILEWRWRKHMSDNSFGATYGAATPLRDSGDRRVSFDASNSGAFISATLAPSPSASYLLDASGGLITFGDIAE